MTNGDSQQESLDALKLINAASTALRLYPADSAQVRNSTDNAYQGVKTFLRKYEQLRFSCHNGVCSLAGMPVDQPTQERLQLLTFNDLLQRMALTELVLAKNFDRPTFKKILSVFVATPEQVKKAGGGRAFVEKLQLGDVFPEEYCAPGKSKEELAKKQKVDTVLQKLAGEKVRPDDLHYLYGKIKGASVHKQISLKFQTAEGASHCVAAACYSLLQILQKEKTVFVAPAFSSMLERVDHLLRSSGKSQTHKYAQKSASLLGPVLSDPLILILLCQHYPESFGSCFYDAIIRSVDTDSLGRVYQWMERQHEKSVASVDGGTDQMRVVCVAYERFQHTSRAKQLMAADNARKLLVKTEGDRKLKRVQAGIEALADGNMLGLKNKEVCISLPSTLANLLNNGKESLAAAIIQNIVNGYKEENYDVHSCFSHVMGGVAAKLVALKRWDWLEKLTPLCLVRIRQTEELDSSYSQYVQAMQDMMNYAWATGNNDLAEQILDIFYYIRSGAFEKSKDLCVVIAEIQDENVDLALLQAYLDECFIRPVDELICKKITMQGPVAARFLLDTLISTDERSDRIRLLKLLSEIGEGLVPVLLERLPDPMPWYGKRNIIRLLAVTGSETDVAVVLPYMTYDDLRVQQESLQCIIRLAKASRGKFLLQVLPKVSARMQIQIVQSLGLVADESVVVPLAELLRDCKLYEGENKNTLAEEICFTLNVSGSEKAIPVLQKVVDSSGKLFGKKSHTIALNAIETLLELKRKRRMPKKALPVSNAPSKKQVEKSVAEKSTITNAVMVEYESISNSAEEAEVYTLLSKDKLEGAKKKLLSLIEKTASTKQFKQAEALRLRLVDIDPMALADIVQAAEYIVDAKTVGVDKDHIIIWSELYDLLSTEEFNEFYQSLVHEKYGLEKNVVNQGDTQWRLFFVNKGRVKLYYQEKETEILVKTIGSGQVFGGESFFNDSVCTLNATSMGGVELSTLAVDKLEEWKETFPELEPKIQRYCKSMSSELEFFQGSGATRRNEERHDFRVPLSLEMLTEESQSDSISIEGMGSDISKGGLSFVSQIDRRKHARMLLGRSVKVFAEYNGVITEFIGRVVAVRNLHVAEHGRSVHIAFAKELEEQILSSLTRKA